MNKQELYFDIKTLIENFCEKYEKDITKIPRDYQQKDLSFFDLLEQFDSIIIPIIQRDYAQGRMDTEAKYIREEFLNDIKDILKSNYTLHLDYIYGNVNNKNQFEPLDGQQRLTTLFLIYLYLYKKNGNNSGAKLLKKFTYQTRTSARDFFSVIVDNLEIPNKEEDFTKKIKDSSWFVYQWEQDPTVKGCLNMLSDIHKKFSVEVINIKNLENIKFNLLDIGKLYLSDDLYIKMNSRGKSLTDFENLKAQMIQYIKEHNIESEFSKNIDNAWSEFLWEKFKEKEVIDNMHIKIIIIAIIYTMTAFVLEQKTISDKIFAKFISKVMRSVPDNKKKTGKIIFDFFKNKRFGELFHDVIEDEKLNTVIDENFEIEFKKYKNNNLIANIEKIYKIIIDRDDFVSKVLQSYPINYDYKSNDDFLKNITDLILIRDFSYQNSFMFFGQIFYFEAISNDSTINPKDFYNWTRFVRNLTSMRYFSSRNNKLRSEAYIRDERFLKPFKLLHAITNIKSDTPWEKYININNDVKLTGNENEISDEEKENSSILSKFIAHEKDKAKYMLENLDKEQLIVKLENNILFTGNLQFIFNELLFSTDMYKLCDSINKCFYVDKVSDDFRFAILSIDNNAYDFLNNHHNCYMYDEDCNNVIKYRLYENFADIQWCIEKGTGNINKFFKNLFIKIAEFSNFENPLRKIIEIYLENSKDKSTWQYCFIKKYQNNELQQYRVPYIVLYQPDKKQPPKKVSYLRIERPQDCAKDFYLLIS